MIDLKQTGRFIGGVAALAWSPRLDKYLLLRRSDAKDFAAGLWECVGGRVDQGEGFEDALLREVHEELGVETEIELFLGTTHFYRGEPGPENELIGIACLVSVENPDDIQLSDEHSEGRWVSLAEARQILTGDSPSNRWLLGLLERAEALRNVSTPAMRDYFRQRGVETNRG